MTEGETIVQRVLRLLTRTVSDVGDAVGASYDAARSWRQGRRSPSAEHLERLADLAEEDGEELRDLASDLRDAADQKRGS
jgi:transcriptional regulator with XRE-family HTH domain